MPENRQYDRVKEITEQLEAGIADLFQSEQYMQWLTTMSRFHDYSLNNTILIALQRPDATMVAGYSSWQRNFGRQVAKGAKGIRILAPTPYKQKVEVDKTDPDTGEVLLNPDGTAQKEMQEILRPAFKVVNVFDVSDTTGRELPKLGVNELTGDVEQFELFFEALKRTCPVPMEFEQIHGGAKGYYHQVEQRIAIQEGMSQVQTVKTAIHEMAHQKLHAIDPEKKTPGPDPEKISRNGKEVEAESVAYTVCRHFGIDTSDYSFAYIAGWSHGKETPELKASLNTIRSAASEMIRQIEGYVRELVQEREAKAEDLAEKLDAFAQEIDLHGYRDAVEDPEAAVIQLKADILEGGDAVQGMIDDLQEIAEENEDLAGNVSVLIAQIQPFMKKNVPEKTEEILEKSTGEKAEITGANAIHAGAPDVLVAETANPSDRHGLSAEDIRNIRCISSRYYPHMRTSEHELTCEIHGEQVMLTYEVSGHDDGEGFTVHSNGQDIWDVMSERELRKLEPELASAVEYRAWIERLEQAETAEDVQNVRYGLMETESFKMKNEQRNQLWQAIDEKEIAFTKEAAYQIGDHYLEIHEAADGSWDFTLYGPNYREVDGGQIGEPGTMRIDQAVREVMDYYQMPGEEPWEMDWEQLSKLTELYNPDFEDEQIHFMGEVIRQGYDPKAYWVGGQAMDLTTQKLSAQQIEDIRYQVKVDAIPKMLYSREQWHEIEAGIARKADVTAYANPNYSPEEMRRIRKELTGEGAEPEQQTWRYYSTQRPVGPGTFPKPPDNHPVEIHNYDRRQPMEDGCLQAWGYLEYLKPLTEKQMQDYELKPVPEAAEQSVSRPNTGAKAPERPSGKRKSVLADLREKQARIAGADAPQSAVKCKGKEIGTC